MKDQQILNQTEEVLQNACEAPEGLTPKERLVETAKLVGIEIGEQSQLSNDEVIEKLIDKLISKIGEIDENLRPLAEAMTKDTRVRIIINSLCDGLELEEILARIGTPNNAYEDVDPEKYEKHFGEADKFCTTHKLEHSEIECFAEYVKQLFNDIYKGEISLKLLEVFWMSYNFETEMQNAYRAGVLKGRNTHIEQMTEEQEETDGLGHVAAGGAISQSKDDSNYIERLMSKMR